MPHGVWPADPAAAGLTPVLVGSLALPDSHRDVLINLAADAPADFSAYARVCEIVGGDEAARKAGRTAGAPTARPGARRKHTRSSQSGAGSTP